jgi:hypothetical protein
MSLQIRYKWIDGAPARGAMILGAYHSLPAPVRTIPLAQIRAPVDIPSFIHNRHLRRGRSQDFYWLEILQKQEDKRALKGKGIRSVWGK